MFPDICRDDIFRLETRRLWLRWPEAADARRQAEPPEAAMGDPYRDPEVIRLRRADMARGCALHLVMADKTEGRRVVGRVSLTRLGGRSDDAGLKLALSVAPGSLGQGLATEAAQAMIDAAFLLTGTPLVAASARVLDPALRRVLEKCGFTACGLGLDATADGLSLTASDRFRLDRKAWASLKGWRMPELVARRVPSPEPRPLPCTA